MTDKIQDTPHEPSQWFAAGSPRKLNIRLMGAAAGLTLALLIAPGSRRLFLAQAGLCVPVPATVASIAGSQLGVRSDPFEGRVAFQKATAAAERQPDDLQVQLAKAAMLPPGSGSNFLLEKIQRSRALETRFGNSPSLYANILRYEAQGEIRVHHNVEQKALGGEALPEATLQNARQMEAQAVSLPVWAAYDRDAAMGERLDPDNAYFPFMRAVGLFGARHDEEALEAMARASHKTQWREYYNDELKGQWKLQDTGFVNNSALFHSVAAMSILFPQYAQMRSAARVTLFEAIKAERAGDFKKGLELRENILRLGSLMRVQSASLIGSLVGNAITDLAIAWPAGETVGKSREQDNDTAQKKRRQPFDAYLRRINATSALNMFHASQQAGDEMEAIVRGGTQPGPFDKPFTNLVAWWMVDLVMLANVLWILVLGGLAVLCLRCPRLQKGLGLPEYARIALPLGLMGGAFLTPFLLPNLSPYFQNIATSDNMWMMLAGFAPILPLLGLPASTIRERLLRIGIFACGLLAGVALTGFYFWQAHGITGIAFLQQIYMNMSGVNAVGYHDFTSKLFWCTPYAALLMLAGSAIVSRVCRVPLSVGIARGFRELLIPVAVILFLIYGGMLLCTMRAESIVEYGLTRTLDNEGQYLADLSGKLLPRSDVAKKMVNGK